MQLLHYSHPVYLYASQGTQEVGTTYTSTYHLITPRFTQDHFTVHLTKHSSRDMLMEWAHSTSQRWNFTAYTEGETLPHPPYPLAWEINFLYLDPSAVPLPQGTPTHEVKYHIPGFVGHSSSNFQVPRVVHVDGVAHYIHKVFTQAKTTSTDPHTDFDFDQHGECVQVTITQDSK